MNRVRTRFAPSPTGVLHIGSVRTALFCWLYARRNGGSFILRIEDTDRERSTQASVDAILHGMSWLGLDPDEGPFYQSQRFDRYREIIDRWLDEGIAYRCYCTREELDAMREDAMARGIKPRYDGRCRQRTEPREGVSPVIRFRNPLEGSVVVDDAVRGSVAFDNSELDDLIIARSDGTPTYNFTVVVDDADMRISHVIRGDDHLNNTPRQINMLQALGAQVPRYAHLPMIHGPDGGKLSKRHGAVNVLDYCEQGFLPDGLLNYLLRLGWSHGDQELFSRDEMIALFDLDEVNHAASTFDFEKLKWVNHQHLVRTPARDLAPLLAAQLRRQGLDPNDGPPLEYTVDALRERGQTIAEIAERAHCYYEEFEAYDQKSAHQHLRPVAAQPLQQARDALAAVADWTEADTQAAIERAAEALGLKLGKVAQPLRVALVGQAASPGIGVTLVLVGRDRALKRIDKALSYIATRAAATGA